MSKRAHKTFKPETEQNKRECFEMLMFSRTLHPSTAVIDVTAGSEPTIPCFTVYVLEDEKLLEARANALIAVPAIRETIIREGGTKVCVLADADNLTDTAGGPIDE